MGSWLMHGIIANKILQQVEIEDREAFLLGALAPDASSNKDVSHFLLETIAIIREQLILKVFYKNMMRISTMPTFSVTTHI